MAELKPVQLTVALLLATGATITATAEKAAITRQTIHQWLNSDYEFMAYINRLKKENTEAARAAIQSAAVLAVETIAAIMKDSDNDTVRLSAAKELLAMAGLTKDTAALLNRGIGATTAHEIKTEIQKAAKFKAQMAAYE
jgi:hypothetical protein